jgi:hypothetical protein
MGRFKDFLEEARIKLGGNSQQNTGIDAFLEEFREMTQPNPFDDRVRVLGQTVVELSKFGSEIHISDIRSLKPRGGAGTRAMKQLMKLADKHGVTLSGLAKAYTNDEKYVTRTRDLVSWYKKLGFRIGSGTESDGYRISYRGR